MTISRRMFIQSSAQTIALAATAGLAGVFLPEGASADENYAMNGTANQKGLPILQTATDASSACFVILRPSNKKLIARVRSHGRTEIPIQIVDDSPVAGTTSSLLEIFVSGLLIGSECRLEIIDEDGELVDSRIFQSLNTSRTACRFVTVSCMHDDYTKESLLMWRAVAEESPDFVVFLGDTVYADSRNPKRNEAGYGRRYVEARLKLPWFRMKRLIPCFATWDDHDFGLDNADKNFPMARVTAQLFRRFWGTRFNRNMRKAFGVGSVMELNGQRFFLMDDRSFRDFEGVAGGRHWGKDQSEWLISELDKSARPAWLMNGSQFFGGYLGKESYEADHKADFKDLLRRLTKAKAPVCFASGDVHFSEAMGIEKSILGYETFEFTSSSIHSLTFPYHERRANNRRRIVSEWRHNFLVFDVDTDSGWKIKTSCVRAKGLRSFILDSQIMRT